uniref:Inositol 1,4,5-triphosphate receptor associated 2 n=1 Tax=Latimeria chalumnae TaxID=7897 RepID=H3BCJ5_LATCH
NEKDIEAEFLRLSLGFKCDIFTLEKRLRLEERSRDLAEESLKKEINDCFKLLESLMPLCEDDNQALEMIKKLDKSLQFLSQATTKMASRAEVLGAIHQESRVSKAVEVMIQHVENLKRMYTTEHAELEDLKQVLLQNERSYEIRDKDDLRSKKSSGAQQYQKPPSHRRVSIAAIPRTIGNAVAASKFNLSRDKLYRKCICWGRLLGTKKKESPTRPSLKRFISSYAWAESNEQLLSKGSSEEPEPPAEEPKEVKDRKLSFAEKKRSIEICWSIESEYDRLSSSVADLNCAFAKSNKFGFSVILLLVLAAFVSFLVGLVFQNSADAAPVGTGDSWTAVQQLLWPYTGLRHNGQPPV